MKEFHHSDLSDFKRSDLNTSEIPYKNAEREKRRQEKLLLLKTQDKPVKKVYQLNLLLAYLCLLIFHRQFDGCLNVLLRHFAEIKLINFL